MKAPIERAFYMRDAVSVARDLLGKKLVRLNGLEEISGVIVETEAYAGTDDAACHSYKRSGPAQAHRTNVMFGPGGYAYVYLIYGMYDCFNVVANSPGEPEAVLIRSLEPREGVSFMMERRKTQDIKKLCSGPGKLCMALGITRAHYGADLCATDSTIFITDEDPVSESQIVATPRINVDYAGEAALLPYRYVLRDSEFLSTKKYLRSGTAKGRSVKCPSQKL